jgi:hypothetical protein
VRIALLVLLSVVALAGPGAASEPTPLAINFRVPAQAEGRLAVNAAEWALLVFPPAHTNVVDLELAQAGKATTYTYLQYTVSEGPLAWEPDSLSIRDSNMPLQPGLRATATFPAGRWGSLFIVADDIELSMGDAQVILGQAEAGSPTEPQLPPGEVPVGTVRPLWPDIPVTSATLGLSNGEQGASFRFEATGVQQLEWHNATVACLDSQSCPDTPAYWQSILPLGDGNDRIEVRNYTELTTTGGHAIGSGQAFLAAMGGARIDVALEGSMRLPGAQLVRCDPDCAAPDEGTLLANGSLTLRGLEPLPGRSDRLRGQLGGTATSARLDEEPRPGLLRASAVAGGAALGLALLAKLMAVLFWRRPRVPPADHPRRQTLQSLVVQEPGLTFRQLQRRVGWANGVTRHHLDHLVRARAIVARPYRNTVRYFENHGRYDTDWQRVVLTRDAEQRWLLDWLAQRGGASQVEIVRAALSTRGWSRSATQRRLKALVSTSLVHAAPAVRPRFYIAPGRPPPLAATGGSYGGTRLSLALVPRDT